MREARIPFGVSGVSDVQVVRYQDETGGGFRNERLKLTSPPERASCLALYRL
jgi:hypothetical protein